MADILLNDGGDIRIDGGDIAVCSDNIDIVQQAKNSICTVIGENPFHPNYGRDKGSRMKYTNQYLDSIEEACTNAISLDDRVNSVLELDAELYNGNQCYIKFSLLTIDGMELNSTCDIEL